MKEKKIALTPVIKASLLENYDSDTYIEYFSGHPTRHRCVRCRLLNLGKSGNQSKDKWLSRD